jgi:dGTP triphosphohydrolase
MGLFSAAMKAGVAKKVIDEARKPQNQRKIKDFVSGLTNKKNGGTPRGGHRG